MPIDRVVVVMPPLKEGGARGTAITHANSLTEDSSIGSVFLHVISDIPQRKQVRCLIKEHAGVTLTFNNQHFQMNSFVHMAFNGLTRAQTLVFHSHGLEADRFLTDLTHIIRHKEQTTGVRVCLAMTCHGEIEQFQYLRDQTLCNSSVRKDLDGKLAFVPDAIIGRNNIFGVARKNWNAFQHPHLLQFVLSSNLASRYAKVCNGVFEYPDTNQTKSQLKPHADFDLPSHVGSISEDRFTFIVASRADSECKGHLIACEALQRVNQIGYRAQLVLLGDGVALDKIIPRIRDGQYAHVCPMGQVSCAQTLMCRMDCHLLLSTCLEESAPVAIVDAQVKGVPTIGTPVGDIADMIEGGTVGARGYVIPLDSTGRIDENELVEYMCRMIRSKDLSSGHPKSYISMSENCRIQYRREYLATVMCDRYAKWYSFGPPEISFASKLNLGVTTEATSVLQLSSAFQ